MAAAESTVTVSIDSLSPSEPSLCIPRVFPNITWQRVKESLEDVGLGEIERVDMVPKKNDDGKPFKRVFVHFKKWATTPEATEARKMVLSGEMFQVVYDDPWFWKIGKSHAAKPERRTKQRASPKKATRPSLKINLHKDDEPTDMSETQQLRAMIEEQRKELEQLRMSIATTEYASVSPKYHPMTPPASDHIARELEAEFEAVA